MGALGRRVCGITDELRQIHMDYRNPVQGKGWHGQSLSEGEGWPHPLPRQAFIGFNLPRNTGCIHKSHQSLSGRNDQIIDNIQRTVRAYSESGSDS